MEKLTINIPKSKSKLVRQILNEPGVFIEEEKKISISDFLKKIN